MVVIVIIVHMNHFNDLKFFISRQDIEIEYRTNHDSHDNDETKSLS